MNVWIMDKNSLDTIVGIRPRPSISLQRVGTWKFHSCKIILGRNRCFLEFLWRVVPTLPQAPSQKAYFGMAWYIESCSECPKSCRNGLIFVSKPINSLVSKTLDEKALNFVVNSIEIILIHLNRDGWIESSRKHLDMRNQSSK